MRSRTIEIDADAADALEAEARTRGLTLPEFLRSLTEGGLAPLPRSLDEMREHGRGPWSPQALAEDVRTIAAFEEEGEGFDFDEIVSWMESWGTANELPMPRTRKF
jgi:hypothetical protein